MDRRFGAAFRAVPAKRKGPGSRFMNSFETAKREFGYSEDEDIEIGPLRMDGVTDSDCYDATEAMVILSKYGFSSAFIVTSTNRIAGEMYRNSSTPL